MGGCQGCFKRKDELSGNDDCCRDCPDDPFKYMGPKKPLTPEEEQKRLVDELIHQDSFLRSQIKELREELQEQKDITEAVIRRANRPIEQHTMTDAEMVVAELTATRGELLRLADEIVHLKGWVNDLDEMARTSRQNIRDLGFVLDKMRGIR